MANKPTQPSVGKNVRNNKVRKLEIADTRKINTVYLQYVGHLASFPIWTGRKTHTLSYHKGPLISNGILFHHVVTSLMHTSYIPTSHCCGHKHTCTHTHIIKSSSNLCKDSGHNESIISSHHLKSQVKIFTVVNYQMVSCVPVQTGDLSYSERPKQFLHQPMRSYPTSLLLL